MLVSIRTAVIEVFPAPLPGPRRSLEDFDGSSRTAGARGRAGGPSVHEAEFLFPGLEGVLGVFQEAADGFPDEGREGRPPAASEASEGPDFPGIPV